MRSAVRTAPVSFAIVAAPSFFFDPDTATFLEIDPASDFSSRVFSVMPATVRLFIQFA